MKTEKLLSFLRKAEEHVTVMLMDWDIGDWQKKFYDFKEVESYFKDMNYTIEEFVFHPSLKEHKIQIVVNVHFDRDDKEFINKLKEDGWREI